MSDIAPLGKADASSAVALWREAGLTRPWNDARADFALALAAPDATLLGMRDEEGSLIGTVMAGFDGHRGWLYCLAVSPARRGEGLGRALVHAAETWLRARGAPAVRLMVRGDNPAGSFYAALGYVPNDVVIMGKRLDG